MPWWDAALEPPFLGALPATDSPGTAVLCVCGVSKAGPSQLGLQPLLPSCSWSDCFCMELQAWAAPAHPQLLQQQQASAPAGRLHGNGLFFWESHLYPC